MPIRRALFLSFSNRFPAPIQATSQTGRCVATISPGKPSEHDFQRVSRSASEFFLVETDTVSSNTPFLTVGRLMQQVGYPFNAPAGGFTATSVGGLTGQFLSGTTLRSGCGRRFDNGDGTERLHSSAHRKSSGHGQKLQRDSEFRQCRYVRTGATNLITPIAPVFYMINQNQAFAVGEINNNPFFGIFEPQSTGPFSASTIKGTFIEGTSIPPTSAVRDISGVLTLDGIQAISGTQDQSTASANTAAQAVTGTYAIYERKLRASGPRSYSPAALTGTFFIVSPTQFVMVTTTSGDINPVLIIVGNLRLAGTCGSSS